MSLNDDSWAFEEQARTRSPSLHAKIAKRNTTQSKFLSLPPEIRFNIYALCLINPLPIIVWSAAKSSYWYRTGMPAWADEPRASTIMDLALGLLRCSRGIATDAAHIFYHKNTFCFVGDHEYYFIITWLDRIGKHNRDLLSSLEIEIFPPERTWQMPDGTRLSREVDVINPAIETIISFFGRPRGTVKVKLVLNLGFRTVPGVDSQCVSFSMDLPNLIEKWRCDYTRGNMTIVWRGEAEDDWFADMQALIEHQGWEILPGDDAERPWLTYTRDWVKGCGHLPLVNFMLKRKQLTGPLTAAEPVWNPLKRARYEDQSLDLTSCEFSTEL
ncbi:MAG: hypothetical protein Q9215_004372 [Flavoplaca cf. flavocitrina]